MFDKKISVSLPATGLRLCNLRYVREIATTHQVMRNLLPDGQRTTDSPNISLYTKFSELRKNNTYAYFIQV